MAQVGQQGGQSFYDQSFRTPTAVNDSPASQTPEQQKTARQVQRLFERARRYRRQYDKDWTRYYEKGLHNKHWKNRPGHRASPVTNFIFADIQTKVPLLTDGSPAPSVNANHPYDEPFASYLENALLYFWNYANCNREVITAAYDAMIYGSGIFKVGFDPEAKGGLGDATMEAINPAYFYPDPDARSMDDARYCIYAIPTPIDEAKRKFSKFAKELGGEPMWTGGAGYDYSEIRRSSSEVLLTSPADHRTQYSSNDPGYMAGAEQQRVLWIECWMSPQICDEIEEIETADPSNPENTITQQQKKYPKGKVVTLIGNLVVQEAPNPFADGNIPFADFPNYLMPREFWGQGEVEQLEKPQESLNKLDGILQEGLALMSNAIWKYKSGTVTEPEKLTNQQGLCVEYSGDSPPIREPGVAPPPEIITARNMIKQDIKELHGAGDASQGIRPAGIEAAAAIQMLQESQQTRIRLLARNMEASLKRVGKLLVSRFLQFWTEPRMIKIASEEKDSAEYYNYHFEDETYSSNAQSMRLKGPALMDPAMEGQPTGNRQGIVQQVGQNGASTPQKFPIMGEFDVTFNAGSALPFAKAKTIANIEKFMSYLANDPAAKNPMLPLIGKVLEIPNVEGIISKLQEQAAPAGPPQPEPPRLTVTMKLETLTNEWAAWLMEQGIKLQDGQSYPQGPILNVPQISSMPMPGQPMGQPPQPGQNGQQQPPRQQPMMAGGQ